MEWIAGNVALDFNNTVSWNPEGLQQERLDSPERVLEWLSGAKLISPGDRTAYAAELREHPRIAAATLERAHELRALLHRLFHAIAVDRTPHVADLASFNEALHEALSHMTVRRTGKTFQWQAAAGILTPIVWHAAQLLTSPDLALVGACANADCGWLFVDRSRKRNRRWCEMRACGSRAKARNYYRRKKQSLK